MTTRFFDMIPPLFEGVFILMTFPARFAHYTYLRHITDNEHKETQVVIAFDEKSKKEVACKVFRRDDENFEMVEQEIRIQQSLFHPHIAQVLDVVYEEEHIFVVMEFFKYGDLLNLLHGDIMTSKELLRIYAQIVSAVNYLHARGIAHLDIKPENIFIDSTMSPKLADFGCCETPLSRKKPFLKRGTLVYAPPELFLSANEDNRPADIWSLGVLLFIIMTGVLPWKPGNTQELFDQICRAELKFPQSMPGKIEQTIRSCCSLEPKERLTATELYDIFSQFIPISTPSALPKIKATSSNANALKKHKFNVKFTSYIHKTPSQNHPIKPSKILKTSATPPPAKCYSYA